MFIRQSDDNFIGFVKKMNFALFDLKFAETEAICQNHNFFPFQMLKAAPVALRCFRGQTQRAVGIIIINKLFNEPAVFAFNAKINIVTDNSRRYKFAGSIQFAPGGNGFSPVSGETGKRSVFKHQTTLLSGSNEISRGRLIMSLERIVKSFAW